MTFSYPAQVGLKVSGGFHNLLLMGIVCACRYQA